jgi:hypothetical protein
MKPIYFLICLFWLPSWSFGQDCLITSQHGITIYKDAPNLINLSVKGYRCKNFTVETDNGKLEATEDLCSYIIYPSETGVVNVIIKKANSRKVLSKSRFTVVNIPPPVAKVANQSGGDIKKGILRVQVGISAARSVFDGKFTVSNFTVTFMRNDKVLFVKGCTGALFQEDVVEAFNMLGVNDRVLFSNMSYTSPDGSIKMLQPIEFKIVE